MFKAPVECFKSAQRLAEMARGDSGVIAAALEPRMAKVLEEGEVVPDVAHFMDVLGRMVLAESQSFDDADQIRRREGTQARYLQMQLTGRAEPELRDKVVEVRRQMVRFLGAKQTALHLGHRGRTPRKLEALEDLARLMVRRLPGIDVPEVGGQKLDAASWAQFIQPSLDRVSDLMDQLYDRQKNEHRGVQAKKTARVQFDQTFRLVLRICKALYKLTGFDRSAKHLDHRAGRPIEQKKVESRGAA